MCFANCSSNLKSLEKVEYVVGLQVKMIREYHALSAFVLSHTKFMANQIMQIEK